MATNNLNISNVSSYIRNSILNRNIGEKNISNNEINSPMDITYSSIIPIDKKRNKYVNYLDYIDSVYGTNTNLINILGGIVSGEGVSLSLNSNSKVGIVSNFDIQSILAGRIVSTLTGYDTPIGTFGLKAAAISVLNGIESRTEKLAMNFENSLLSKFGLTEEHTNYDTSITVQPSESKKIFGISTTTDVINEIEDILGINLNPLTKDKLPESASIYSLENKNIITSNNILDNLLLDNNNENKLISSTGKYNVSILYNLLNQNLYLPNYDNDSRFKKSGLNPQMFYNYYNLFSKYKDNNDNNKNNSWLNRGSVYSEENKPMAFKPISDNTLFQSIVDYDSNGNLISDKPHRGRFKSLLDKTNILFTNGIINTMISNYSFNEYEKINNDKKINNDEIQSAYSEKGISRGRNLLLKDPSKSKIDNDPYCRVWTWQNQYNKFENTMRPGNISKQQYLPFRIDKNLSNSTLDQENGMVKIAPYSGEKNIKNYMFSIENLAWTGLTAFNRDHTELAGIEYGNNGGRIMWFPPYDIKFDENTNVQIESNHFIGRGEPVYTYTNTERKGNLSFKLIVDHPSLINYYKEDTDNTTDGDSNELLRFFAGCDILNFQESQTNSSELPKSKMSPSIPPVTRPKYVVSIYFPNDYSGISEGDSGTTAMKYLYQGQGNKISNDTEKTGYENVSDNGLSIVNFNCNISNKALLKKMGISIEDLNDFNKNIQEYRRDMQKEYKVSTNNTLYLPIKRYEDYYNYYDTTSFSLNNKSGRNLYSFRKFYNIITNKKNNDFIKEFNELSKLLTDESNTININGYASKVGISENNEQLARNRANVVKEFLVHNFPSIKSKNIKMKSSVSGTNDTCISSLNSKQARRVDIIITTKVDSKYPNNPNVKSINKEQTSNPVIAKVSDIKNYIQYESDFFEKIKSSDPLVQKTIQKQIKNFHPAFHSITPEGFNARLTFLHQCTRQGPTVGQTDPNAKTASNLSFGRPPVSVLRIGDFYNTKIMINSLNISYEPLIWDLNPEGIGVQPMIANITLSFNFIGGSDLSGPIARLQNAITSNFFANTSVYDNRSDTNADINATKKETKNDIEKKSNLKLFNPK
jgi:hypothetical protein